MSRELVSEAGPQSSLSGKSTPSSECTPCKHESLCRLIPETNAPQSRGGGIVLTYVCSFSPPWSMFPGLLRPGCGVAAVRTWVNPLPRAVPPPGCHHVKRARLGPNPETVASCTCPDPGLASHSSFRQAPPSDPGALPGCGVAAQTEGEVGRQGGLNLAAPKASCSPPLQGGCPQSP